MSNPLSSLQKHKKLPFPTHVPFRKLLPTIYSESNNRVLDDIVNESVSSELKKFKVEVDRSLRSLHEKKSPRSDVASEFKKSPRLDIPTDHQLMMLMASKYKELESKFVSQSKEIVEKDELIKDLEEKIKILQIKQDSEKIKNLKSICSAKEQQIREMEEFLNDYGLIWLGSGGNMPQDDTELPHLSSKIMWHPEASVYSDQFKIDFALLAKNISELNMLSCQGVSHVEKTNKGARLKLQEMIQLTVYSNGIFLFNGPFRDFSDPTTRQFVIDILDGYFPSELQSRYPEGVPFNYTDKRDIKYECKLANLFNGNGIKLGDGSKEENYNNQYSHEPKKKLSSEQFLNNLPKNYIKNGEILDVREPIKILLQGDPKSRDLKAPILIERSGSSSSGICSRLSSSTTVSTTRLSIRSETGNETYLLTMKITDTLRHVRALINKQRTNMNNIKYDIVSAFPTTKVLEDSSTLESLNLFPSAALHLKSILPAIN